MKRRQFSARLAVTGTASVSAPFIGGFMPALAAAQGAAPVEGTEYVKLGKQQPVAAGKLEVIEFFWYGCPHCNAFEPALEAWVDKLQKDVAFRRVPVAFREEPFVPHQKIYYALEALNQVPQLHKKVFAAIHVDHQRMDKPDEIAAFMGKNGLDPKKFLDAYNSFGVTAKAKQARQIAEDYQLDGVPSIGVQGRYVTSGTYAGTPERSLVVADYLLVRARKGG